jgi:hypothetical protein
LIQCLGLDYLSVAGYPCRTLLNFSPRAGEPLAMKTLVQQELIRRGILWSGIHNLCFAHSEEDIDYTLQAFGEAFETLHRAVMAGDVRSRLQGKLLQPVFRKTSNFNVKPRRAEEAVSTLFTLEAGRTA